MTCTGPFIFIKSCLRASTTAFFGCRAHPGNHGTSKYVHKKADSAKVFSLTALSCNCT